MPRFSGWIALATFAVFAGCTDESPTTTTTELEPEFFFGGRDSLVDEVRRLIEVEELLPLPSPPPVRFALVRLGQALAFDPILSGNRDISCMTCHHPTLATGDARHMSIGQGATGLGKNRVHPDGAFIPRNAPPLFNLHAMDRLFWDGRVAVENGVVVTPAGAQVTPAMSAVFEFGAISALPLFPVTSRSEMRAFSGNELANIDDDDFMGIWSALMARLGNFSEYRNMFENAYPGTQFEDMTFAHASNAIAGFLVQRLAFNRSRWDLFLAGHDFVLTRQELRGAAAFMSDQANCSSCHDGATFTDTNFHNTALAQFGPGQGDGPGGNDDFGRERVSGALDDRYRFRTTPLRNVELTAPYGHAGEFVKLVDFVKHYSDADARLRDYDVTQIEPLLRPTVVPNFEEVIATRSGRLDDVLFTDSIAGEIASFLGALTDPRARLILPFLIPFRVPSGLPVERR